MKKYILFLPISLILILLTSCFLPFGVDPPYADEPWGCLINSDGTGFEWIMRGDNHATFTQDSQKIVYKTSEGIFTRDFEGNIEQISSASYYNYDYYSDDLQYLIDEDDGDIFRMDLDGSNRINLTQTSDCQEYDSNISSDSNWITYTSAKDTIYSIWIMDVNGMNKKEVLSDTFRLYKPALNIKNNSIVYIYAPSYNKNILKSISLDDSTITTTNTNMCNSFEISGSGDIVVFYTTLFDDSGLFIKDEFCSFDISSGRTTILPIYPHDNRYSLDWEGTTVVIGEPISVINLIDNSYIELSDGHGGKDPIISPDGKKIYFKKKRELPIEE